MYVHLERVEPSIYLDHLKLPQSRYKSQFRILIFTKILLRRQVVSFVSNIFSLISRHSYISLLLSLSRAQNSTTPAVATSNCQKLAKLKVCVKNFGLAAGCTFNFEHSRGEATQAKNSPTKEPNTRRADTMTVAWQRGAERKLASQRWKTRVARLEYSRILRISRVKMLAAEDMHQRESELECVLHRSESRRCCESLSTEGRAALRKFREHVVDALASIVNFAHR